MNFILKYKNTNVLKMKLLLYPEGIQVFDFTVLNEDLLPIGLRPFLDASYDKMLQSYLLTEWLMKRSIPDYRINIDEFVLSIHQLPKHLFGRMNGYQHTAALLSYMSSGFDHYILTPEKQEILYLGKQDSRFINLYNLVPKDGYMSSERKTTQNINEYLYKRVHQAYSYDGCFPTDSFTIPSGLPSWWENNNNRKLFIQKCKRDKDRMKAAKMLDILNYYQVTGERSFNESFLVTEFSGISNCDVTWLGEFVPYLKNTAPIKKQLKKMITKIKNKDILGQLFVVEEEMKKQGYDISLWEMGIAHRNDFALPVVIL